MGVSNLANLERAMREVRKRGVAHRGHVREVTGLGANQTNKFVSALREAGLLSSGEHRDYEKQYPLTLKGDAGCLVGVNMTLDRITVGIADLEYRLLNNPAATVRQVPITDWQRTLSEIATTVAAELKACELPAGLVGLGIGLPGPVQRGSGSPEADHLLPGWKGVPVARELERRLGKAGVQGCKVAVGNDASLGALGVLTRAVWGNPAGAPEDLLYLRVTHGVGLGVTVKGHLVTGADGFAGEIGHVRTQPVGFTTQGPLCGRCGSPGCLEALASERAVIESLQRHAWQRAERGPNTVRDFANSDEPDVVVAVGRAAFSLAFVLAAAANVLNPRWILLGGDMTEMAMFRESFDRTLDTYTLDQARTSVRTTTWKTMFDDAEFPLERSPDIGRTITPEMLGAMAFVVDELADTYLESLIAPVAETLKVS